MLEQPVAVWQRSAPWNFSDLYIGGRKIKAILILGVKKERKGCNTVPFFFFYTAKELKIIHKD
jgi:hypothetical protein